MPGVRGFVRWSQTLGGNIVIKTRYLYLSVYVYLYTHMLVFRERVMTFSDILTVILSSSLLLYLFPSLSLIRVTPFYPISLISHLYPSIPFSVVLPLPHLSNCPFLPSQFLQSLKGMISQLKIWNWESLIRERR